MIIKKLYFIYQGEWYGLQNWWELSRLSLAYKPKWLIYPTTVKEQERPK